jgi:hypothetical protein
MGIKQMQALAGGRRIRRPYIDEINARTPYLPQLYNIKRQEQMHRENWALEQKAMAQQKEFETKRLNMMEEQSREARKRNRTARNLGYAGLGLQAGMGAWNIAGQPSLSDIGSWFSGGSASGLGGVQEASPGQSFGVDDFGGGLYDDIVSEFLDIDFGF